METMNKFNKVLFFLCISQYFDKQIYLEGATKMQQKPKHPLTTSLRKTEMGRVAASLEAKARVP